jgi:LmbE family N-acetylglucosaminyl deacetylase
MQAQLGLMAILAHPDDESMGTGGILAKYAAEGVETYLVTATRGERGWWGEKDEYAGPEAVGDTREQELRAAAEVLGLKEVNLLGYLDKELDQADPAEVIRKLVTHLIDTVDHWKTIWQAIACHRSQLPGYQSLLDLPDEFHRKLWGAQTFYRVYSLANGGRSIEQDLFSGLR